MGAKAKASNSVSKPAETETLVSPETPNVPCRPEQLAGRSLNRPLNLKHRKLPPRLPPAIVSRRSSSQTTNKTMDLRQPRLNSSTVGPDEPGNETQVAPLQNSLQLRGNYWEICYESHSAIIDDSRGLRYIALLIQHTGESKGPLHAAELVALAKGAGNSLVELPSKDPVIDDIAENQITRRLEQIAFERNNACARGDYDRVAVLDGEVEEITTEFERLKGGPGRKKATFNNDGEKARKAVSKAIADTLAKLGGLPEMESLAKHLTEAIRKGQWLSYNGNAEWKIHFSAT